MCRYAVFEVRRVLEGSQEYTGYGICIADSSARISDISSERSVAEELVSILNSEDVDPVHMMDIVEDHLI